MYRNKSLFFLKVLVENGKFLLNLFITNVIGSLTLSLFLFLHKTHTLLSSLNLKRKVEQKKLHFSKTIAKIKKNYTSKI